MYYGKSLRKRPLFHNPSLLSPDVDDDDKTSNERSSAGSKKSGLASIRSGHKSMAGFEVGGFEGGVRGDNKWFKLREYLLLLIEAFLALSAYAIRERNFSSEEEMRLKLTSRQADIYMHLIEGNSAWVSLAIGCLADSYVRHYTMALFSVILHFAAVCIVFMEHTIIGPYQENPYAAPIWNACCVALVLAKSTDFTRLVYGLDGMTNRRTSTVCLFIFLHFWVSSYGTYGGIFLNAFSSLFIYFRIAIAVVAFVLSSISLFLFVYLLYPETRWIENRGLGCAVLGCLLLATYYKILRIRKRGRRGFFSNTEGTYNKTTISKTKEILLLYALLLPSFVIALFIMLRANIFFDSAIRAVKKENFPERVGLRKLSRVILLTAMFLSYVVLWPLLRLVGFENKNTYKFMAGYLLAAGCYFYSASLTKTTERLQYPETGGFIRVFNTREKPVHFIPEDMDFTNHSFDVHPKKGVILAYTCWEETLFAMRVVFNGTNTNHTIFLSVIPDHTIGYMILQPPEVIRIRGPVLPILEGPPGTNQLGWARMYIYNTAKTLEGATINIKYANEKRTLRKVVIQPGIMTTISLEPAKYEFSISHANINEAFAIEEGALYGMMIYSTLSSREMVIDTVLGPQRSSPWPLLGLFFVIGLADGLCYPALRAMIFTIAPNGLMGMSFAFLSFLEGMALWFMYIGFRTWHYFVTGNVLFVYAAVTGISFFLFLFLLLKYNDHYS